MELVDDVGHRLDANYLTEPEGSYIALILESRSGVSGPRPPRNPDYNQALTALLARLGQLNAVLMDAVVDSRHVHDLGLPDSDRRLIQAPVRLAVEPDMDALRLRMGMAQAKIAQAPDATKGGNSTKRIRLRLQVPGYLPGDSERLATALAAPIPVATPAFILTWHPLHFRWEERDYGEAIEATAAGQVWRDDWTVGVKERGIKPGDRAFLYRQHQQRGLVASGAFTSGVETGEHWDGGGRQARYGQLGWDAVLDYEDRLRVEELREEVPEVKWDHIQGSGIEVEPTAVRKLGKLWDHHLARILFRSPDQPRGLNGQSFPEGALTRVEINRYERDRRARRRCLEHWGYRCVVCNVSFEERYGPIGHTFIHVHHLRELSQVPPGYQVDPVNDLRPICPNCHAMIHRGPGTALTVEELRQHLRR